MSGELSRRSALFATGAGVVGAAALAASAAASDTSANSVGDQAGSSSGMNGLDAAVDFRGERQAGIITPAQDRLHFVALNVETSDPDRFRDMLTAWTRAAERMTAGAEAAPGGLVGGGPQKVPQDTGEAYGLPASGLTITIGYGPALFDDRFGLARRRPAALADLPAFPLDQLDPETSGGDLCIQACANDPQVAVHAVRNLVRLGFGIVSVKWSQLGFGRTSSTSVSQETPRNMFGFKDGTNNLKAEEPDLLRQHVWVDPADVGGAAGQSAWMAGGTYLVARRIRMHIEVWDRTNLAEQEAVFGRDKKEGAPLGKVHEFDPLDFTSASPTCDPAIPANAHVRLAHADNLQGVRILRRGYNFTDGSDGLGHLNAGLFFIAFMRDPAKQFVPMQMALAKADALNEYIEHTGSAVFACPPGLGDGQDWGTQLFG